MSTNPDTALTTAESQYLSAIQNKDFELRAFLAANPLPEQPKVDLWFDYLKTIKDILGNLNNSIGFVATLLAKRYLSTRFDVEHFDAAEKAQGASGPDILVRTVDGQTVQCEIKTTRPYQPGFGAQQKVKIKEDLRKLTKCSADYRLMLVTDQEAFRALCKPYYAGFAEGLEIVNLLTGEAFRHQRT